ncbi:MAG: hypothetical protein PHE29_13660 [Tissierellia bacterium]|nr:hypothetical protein [Tissierellia bacterium]
MDIINLIEKIRNAAHKERRVNREATELQLYSLELCSYLEKNNFALKPKKFLDFIFDPNPDNDETHSITRYKNAN